MLFGPRENMQTRIRHHCLAIVLMIASLSVSAKTVRQYMRARWQDPLPHTTVLSLAQTGDGFLWVGTYEGLARFDGNEFAVFDKHNTPLESAAISSLLSASDGTLWIGTVTGGLYRMTGGVIARMARSSVSGSIRALAEDRQHTVWAAGDRGIARLSLRDARLLPIPNGAQRTTVRAISATGDDVWFATDGEGLARFTGGRFTDYTIADGLSSNVIFSLLPTHDGRLLIGTQGGGLDVFAHSRFETIAAAGALAKTSLFALAEERDGSVWISAEGKGVCHLAGESFDCAPLIDGAAPDVSRSMLVDREGNLWLGGTNSGLQRINEGKVTSATSETDSDSMRSVTQSGDGTIWGGGEGVGVQFLHDGILIGDGRNPRLPSLSVRSVLADRDGSLWVESIAGLTHITGKETRTYTVADGLTSSFVYALEQDRDGSLWIGTSTGVSHFAGGTITTLPSDAPADVRALHSDSSGHLWAGTRNGLRCLIDGRITRCGEGALRDASIFAFHADAAGALWIGTNRGLVRMRDGHATVYSMRDGLFDDTVFAILEEDQGTLWMSCNKGIHFVRKSDLDAYDRHAIPAIPSGSFDKSDGMAATQCNGATQPAAWKSLDGRLWFPTVNGLVAVDPKHLPRNTLPPPVVIEQFLVNGKAVPPATLSSLSPESHNLEFHYAALSFVAPEKIRYRYRLEGFDPNWIDAESRHVAYYTNVPSGSYRFVVIASNNDGVWNMTGDSLAMRIVPHYYDTWWFRALALLAVATVIVTFYRVRLWQVRKNERHLIALVAEQTEELRKAKRPSIR